MDGAAYDPRTVEEVFRDYKGRRIGIIKALTTDAEEFFRNCDPGKDNLCLYGFPNETWEVNLPAEEVPPEIPEPALGINFARDGMPEKQWLAMVAVHSDSWLASVSYFFSARFAFDKNDRKRLFTLINDLPTIHEVVTGRANRKSPPRTINSKSKSNSNNSNSNSKLKGLEISTPRHSMPPKKKLKSESSSEHEAEEGLDEEKVVQRQKREIEEEGDGIDEHGDTLCGACGDNYVGDEFWICCDVCEKWFHGKCVKVTPAKAESIKQYKCPACNNNKRPRPS